ncbi:MAG: hypothetical protein R3C61_14910 [Bacteroidia bacterium]
MNHKPLSHNNFPIGLNVFGLGYSRIKQPGIKGRIEISQGINETDFVDRNGVVGGGAIPYSNSREALYRIVFCTSLLLL